MLWNKTWFSSYRIETFSLPPNLVSYWTEHHRIVHSIQCPSLNATIFLSMQWTTKEHLIKCKSSSKTFISHRFSLVLFCGIPTIINYLMPNPFNTYILNRWLIFLNEPELSFFLSVKWFHLFLSNTNTQLNVKTVLFLTILLSINTVFCLHTVKWKAQFYFKQLCLA